MGDRGCARLTPVSQQGAEVPRRRPGGDDPPARSGDGPIVAFQYGPAVLVLGALIFLAVGITTSGSGVLPLVLAIALSVAALALRTFANRSTDGGGEGAPASGRRPRVARHDDVTAPTVEWVPSEPRRPSPPFSPVERAPSRAAPASYPDSTTEEGIRSIVESCLRIELDELRADVQQSQEAVVATVLESIDGLVTAERERRDQLVAAVGRAQGTMLEHTASTDEKLDRLLRGEPRPAMDGAATPADVAKGTDLRELASTVQMGLDRQAAVLTSGMETTTSAIESILADAEVRLDARLEAWATRMAVSAPPAAPQVSATNSALSPIRSDIRMVRNEIAAVERAVAELRATVERQPPRRPPSADVAPTPRKTRPPASPKS